MSKPRKDLWTETELAVIEEYADKVIVGMSYYKAVREVYPARISNRTANAIQSQIRLAVLRKVPGFTTLDRDWAVGNRGSKQ